MGRIVWGIGRAPRALRSLRYPPFAPGRGGRLAKRLRQQSIGSPFRRGGDRGTPSQRHDAAPERLRVLRANTLTVKVFVKAMRGIQRYNSSARPAWAKA